MSGHERTDQLLSPIRIIVRIPEPDCFLRYRIGYTKLCSIAYAASELRCYAEFYVRKIPPIRIWGRAARASRGFKMVLLTELSDNLYRRVNALYRVPSSCKYCSQSSCTLIMFAEQTISYIGGQSESANFHLRAGRGSSAVADHSPRSIRLRSRRPLSACTVRALKAVGGGRELGHIGG